MTDTILVLSGMGVPDYSARGLTQTLQPISASIHLERAANGGLLDLSAPQMRKYASKISCTDQQTPAIGGIWPGAVVTVDCVAELSYPTAFPARRERTAVPGTDRVVGDFTFYRPRLTMVVLNFSDGDEEYAAQVVWSLDLEEE